MTKALPYDSAEFLTAPEAAAAYLEEALATHDDTFIAKAHETVERAKINAAKPERPIS